MSTLRLSNEILTWLSPTIVFPDRCKLVEWFTWSQTSAEFLNKNRAYEMIEHVFTCLRRLQYNAIPLKFNLMGQTRTTKALTLLSTKAETAVHVKAVSDRLCNECEQRAYRIQISCRLPLRQARTNQARNLPSYCSLVGTVLTLFQTGGILVLPNKQKSTLIFLCFRSHLSRFQYLDN